MLNALFVEVQERLIGRKTAAVPGEITGTTERTWRTRLLHGWDPSEEEISALNERTNAAHLQRLVKKGGGAPDEALVILGELPSIRENAWLPAADLIVAFDPLCQTTCRVCF